MAYNLPGYEFPATPEARRAGMVFDALSEHGFHADGNGKDDSPVRVFGRT